jgi:N-acetylglucosaminyldiphosphoundecaprenol N-acetyl-beta-D-mannosaminyltransferase
MNPVAIAEESKPGAPQAVSPAHVLVGPVRIFNGSLREAVQLCMAAISTGAGARVATANLDFVALADQDPVLRADLASSTLVVADGAPIAWLARLAGAKKARRAAGVDLAEAICRAGAVAELRVAMYGATADIAGRAARNIESACPGVRVVGIVAPPFRELSADEVECDLRELLAGEPQLILIALGCPRQERFIAQFSARAKGAVWIGVGGTFDFWAGRRRRAPRALQRLGLEWTVRLVQDPRRLAHRYFLRDIPALLRLTAVTLKRHRAPSLPPASIAEAKK